MSRLHVQGILFFAGTWFARLLIATNLFLLSPQASSEGISFVTVRSIGVGQSEVKATDNALARAVGQVNGVHVKSVLSTSERLDESASGNQAVSNFKATVIDQIESRTKGAIKAYSVVSMGADRSSGLVKAVLDVQVPVLKKSAQLARMRVAVAQGADGDPALTVPTRAAVEEFLVGTRKFAVLDRRQTEASEREFARIREGLTPVEEMARVGVAPAADFLVLVGANRASGASGRIAGNITLLDYSTGQVRYSKTSSLALLGNSKNDLGASARRLGVMMASTMVDYGFPASVIGVAGQELTIDAGESRFGVGEAVQVFALGGSLKDPNTGEKRGQLEVPVGSGKVVRTAPLVSVVRIDTGDPLKAPVGSLVRRAEDAQQQNAVEKNIDDFLGGDK